MKIQKLLLATMLCSVFGIFAACSDDVNPVTGEPETTVPVEEEVETILAFAANVDNGNLSTRAENQVTDPSVDKVAKLAIALFYVKDGKPGDLITIQKKEEISPDDQNGSEPKGYYMNPIKFKIAPDKEGKAKVAVVALANYGNLFEKVADGDIKNFEAFKEFTSAKMYNNFGQNYVYYNGEITGAPIVYPMSSNVLYYEVLPGKVNSIGYKESKNALSFINSYYNNQGNSVLTEANRSADSMIDLYRGAAEIELKSIKFENYGDMQFDHFILEEVFIMNLPTMVNWFDPTLPDDDGYSKSWGGDLNVNFADYATSKEEYTWANTALKSFMSGNKRIDGSGFKGSIPFTEGEFCSNDMFSYTSYNKGALTEFLMFPHNKGANNEVSNYRDGAVDSKLVFFSTDPNAHNDVYGRFLNESIEEYGTLVNKKEDLGINVYSMRKSVDPGATPAWKFAVSPSNYSLSSKGLVSDKAICLVVRGRYYYRSGGQIIGPDNKKYSDSRYYTVVVNKEGESQISETSVPAHSNCVKRNVCYEISLTISGPGSDTPWDYTENSYVVPKVKIVPFGLVEQNSKLD